MTQRVSWILEETQKLIAGHGEISVLLPDFYLISNFLQSTDRKYVRASFCYRFESPELFLEEISQHTEVSGDKKQKLLPPEQDQLYKPAVFNNSFGLALDKIFGGKISSCPHLSSLDSILSSPDAHQSLLSLLDKILDKMILYLAIALGNQ